MKESSKTEIVKDVDNKKVTVTRKFDAEPEMVWKAWTDGDILNQWWAPKPWKAETKEFDFRVGGHWLYAMAGPDGSKHWARIDYTGIDQNKSFEAVDAFCDENGNLNNDMASMKWKNVFQPDASGTKVTVEISFKDKADMEQIISMGFEEGFTAGLGNLDEYLAAVGRK